MNEATKRILVIDDDVAIRKSFLLALEETGYQVDTAESGEKGIERCQSSPYDLIFLDLKMPGLNGVETLIKVHTMGIEVPIYIITAFHEEFLEQLANAGKEGIRFEVIRKPIGADQIRLVVKSVLEGPVIY